MTEKKAAGAPRLQQRLRAVLSWGLSEVREFLALLRRWVLQTFGDPTGRRRGAVPAPLPELDRRLYSRGDWEALLRATPALVDAQTIRACAEHICAVGIDFHGEQVPGYRIRPAARGNYREGLRVRGLNCRMRALSYCLFSELDAPRSAVVYAPEQLSSFAAHLADRLPEFIGSEYLPDPRSRERHRDLRHEDLEALSFADRSLDRIVIGDVFEHVSDLGQVLRELRRVLRPGGLLYATFPFALNRHEHQLRARRVDGRIEHLQEPEYHRDPLSSDGALVYQIPGWQILDDCRKAGFDDVSMRLVSSCRQGIIAADVAGVLVLRGAVRSFMA